MNRREALAALMALPPATRISVADLKPDDTIVVEVPHDHISTEQLERMRDSFASVWPKRKVIVLTGGATFKVVKG